MIVVAWLERLSQQIGEAEKRPNPAPTNNSITPMNRYQICIKDHLAPKLAAWFGNFTLQHTPDGHTLLIGSVCDQAALYGAVERCRDLGLTLISINSLENQPDQE